MHILVENNLIYLYDNINYYKTTKSTNINDFILECDKIHKTPHDIIAIDNKHFYSPVEILNYIKVIDYFELNFPDIYNLVLAKSGNINQFNAKLMTDGITVTMGEKLDHVFAIQLIKTWYYRVYSKLCIPYFEDKLNFFTIDSNSKWKPFFYNIKLANNIIPIKEL